MSLVVIRFLFGAGEAGALPNSARILREWFPESSRGRAEGIVTTAMLLGGAASYATSQWLIDRVGWRWSFAVFALIGVGWAFAFYLWFRDDPADHPQANDAERRLIALGRLPGDRWKARRRINPRAWRFTGPRPTGRFPGAGGFVRATCGC